MLHSNIKTCLSVLAQWSQDWKMTIAGEKTQGLTHSQTTSDRDITIKVDGTAVKGEAQLNLLGSSNSIGCCTSGATAARCARRSGLAPLNCAS